MKIQNLQVVAGGQSLALTWTASGTGDNAIIVKWRTSSSIPWSAASAVELPVSARSYTITGLTDGVAYQVQVVPVQFSPWSQTASGTPVGPAGPLAVAVGASSGFVVLAVGGTPVPGMPLAVAVEDQVHTGNDQLTGYPPVIIEE